MKFILFVAALISAHQAHAWNAEVQIALCNVSAKTTLQKIGAELDKKKVRQVFYHETSSLDLVDMGVVIRDRQSKKKLERTVKLKLAPGTRIGGEWRELEGFKCEFDSYKESRTFTCSLESEVEEESLAPARLLTADQRRFITSFKPDAVAHLRDLRRIGTLENNAYQWSNSGFEILLEQSDVGGQSFVEISTRVGEEREAEATQYLEHLLRTSEIETCESQSSPTKEKLNLLEIVN